MQDNTGGWPKRITVERKIVNVLSRSLYSDFPRAIREAVSNSYDADATVVKIQVDLRNREIVVEDNGNGMSVEQFASYLRIAGIKGEGGFSEKLRRKRIGRFGIGFLAGFPFCESIEITSKREGSEAGFTARIPTRRFVEDQAVEEDVSSIPIDGYNEPLPGKGHEHHTRIRLIGLTKIFDEYWRERPEKKRISIESEPGMKRLRWQLCETLPLDFRHSYTELARILGNEPVGMEVSLNGERLYRSDPGGQVVASSGQTYIKLGNLEFRYAITTNWKIIHPIEARGLKVRLNGVGIGARTYFDVEKESRAFSRLNWLTGEVHVMAGLDESLGLTRDSFIWTTDYQGLKDFFSYEVLLRAHGHVETIAKVEKDIKEAFSAKATVPSVSAMAVIDRSIRRLESSGFQIAHKTIQEVGDAQYPMIIDKKGNMATVIDDYRMGSDGSQADESGVRIRYKAFGRSEKFGVPVRLAEDGTIELNTSYPVFSSKRKGEILRRVHLLLFLAKEECKSVEEMYGFLVRRIREDFE